MIKRKKQLTVEEQLHRDKKNARCKQRNAERKKLKFEAARKRQYIRDTRTNAEQIKMLDDKGFVANKERERL